MVEIVKTCEKHGELMADETFSEKTKSGRTYIGVFFAKEKKIKNHMCGIVILE